VQSRETEAEIISLSLYQTRKNTWEQSCHYIFLFFGKLVILTKIKSQGSQKSFLQWKLAKSRPYWRSLSCSSTQLQDKNAREKNGKIIQ